MSQQYGGQPSHYPSSGSSSPDSPWISVFAYIFGIISAIVVLLTEHKSAYNYFHGWQSFGLAVIYIVGVIPAAIIDAAIGIVVLWVIWTILTIIVFIICMFMAYQRASTGQYFKLPLVGGFAERRASRFVAH